MRFLRTTQLLSLIVLSSAMAPVNVYGAVKDIRTSLLGELNAALTKLGDTATELDSIGTSIDKVRTDVTRLAADLTISTSATNTKLIHLISSRVDRIQKRLDRVKVELVVLGDTFGKIQKQATAASMPMIARSAAGAVAKVDALGKRTVVEQSRIDQLRKDIRTLAQKKVTDP